ncbi:MAG: hypothetical protein M3365_06620 [Gemmatimonadota bacterium]|nr:hypothetical protein [Gemmatimonadota bacterium]
MSERNAALRALIEHRFPDATPVTHRTAEPVATGIEVLDEILPGRGLPRGRLTVWMPQGGASAVLRAACHTTVAGGERAVWIDGLGTVAGPFWEEGPILVRPRNRKHGLRGAEELLRSGGFALVVIAGIEPEGTETVRLSRAAREGGGALVTLTTHASMASLRIASQILRESYRWRKTPFGDPAEAQEAKIRVRVRSLGWNRSADFPVPVVPYDLRMAIEPGLVDRRGASRTGRATEHEVR